MRRILAGAAVVIVVGGFLAVTLGASNGPKNSGTTYKIEIDNSFGLVVGSDFKVAGVPVGSIKNIELCQYSAGAHCQNPLHAVVTVSVTQKGFGQFHSDVFCQSRPQSLIGEYFIDCEPGNAGAVLPTGSTIPANHTQSTIPADLVQNIMRLPYRERFTILINELGAAVAARSEDLQTALRRADPALAETDNLLNLLANDAQTIKSLNVNADSVITALAKGAPDVQRFVEQANNASTASSVQAANIQATWQKLPAFLEQLRPALAKLGAAADSQDPVLANLNQAASNLNRFFADLVPFSHESVPSLKSLGEASKTGIPAVQAATPTVADLKRFAKGTPELAGNLAIVLRDLDSQSRAVETDLRSPGGKGYSGLEAILQYAFNITNAISYFSTWGHLLGVDAYVDQTCAPYATPQTIANNLASYVKGGGDLSKPNTNGMVNPRSCYAMLGPNQPGVTQPDPSFNSALASSLPGQPNGTNGCVPDPGGAPVEGYGTSYKGAPSSACKLAAASSGPASDQSSKTLKPADQNQAGSGNPAASGAPPGGLAGTVGAGGKSLNSTLGSLPILGQLTGTVGNATRGVPLGGLKKGAPARTGGSPSQPNPASQAQQLLNYLLAP